MAGRIILETERFVLREFTEDDAEAFLPLVSDPAVTRYTGDGIGGERTIANCRAELQARPIADYAKHGYGRWACVLKESGKVVGFNGLKYLDDLQEVDIGYRFLEAHWGRGYATETSRPIIEYGFAQLGLTRIIGLVLPENVGSVRVLEKLGMRYADMVDYHAHSVAKYVISRP